eukprot:3321615-Lingulodinium_polyedra.AAC.1
MAGAAPRHSPAGAPAGAAAARPLSRCCPHRPSGLLESRVGAASADLLHRAIGDRPRRPGGLAAPP